MPYVVVVDYMVVAVELKANFCSTRFSILKTTQRERGPHGLYGTVFIFHVGAVAASGEPVVVRAESPPIQLYAYFRRR